MRLIHPATRRALARLPALELARPLAVRRAVTTLRVKRSPRGQAMSFRVGDTAPDFVLQDSQGRRVQLKELLRRGPAVVYFYPKDETPGCTAEACAFRDAYEDFKKEGAEVVGISSDSAGDHNAFAHHHRLPFTLLSDVGGEVRARYQVKPGFLGLVPGRVTFVIDREGIIRHIFDSGIQPAKHVKEALRVLRSMHGERTNAHGLPVPSHA
jgi:peroxiredoxin Q/BCP